MRARGWTDSAWARAAYGTATDSGKREGGVNVLTTLSSIERVGSVIIKLSFLNYSPMEFELFVSSSSWLSGLSCAVAV